jgi:Phage Mu protein F like protein
MTQRLTEQTEAEFRRELERLIAAGDALTDDARRALLLRFDELNRSLRSQAINTTAWEGELDSILSEIDDIVLLAATDIQRLGLDAHQRAWLAGEGRSTALLEIGTQIPGGVQAPFFLEPAPSPGFLILPPARPVVLEAVHRTFTFDRIVAVTTEMQAAIRGQVIAAWIGQLSPFQAMQNITHIIGIRNLPGFRELGTTGISAKAERIFRTELMSAQNMAAWDKLQGELGRFPDLQKIWLSAADDRVRDEHLAAHGQVVAADGFYVVGGEQAQYPLDPALSIGNRANCRCDSVPYRESWGPVDELIGPLTDQVEAEKERRAAENYRVRYAGSRILMGMQRSRMAERLRVG